MTPDSPPLLSIVIPTHRRPEQLPRAVASALAMGEWLSVEVIVVANGPDERAAGALKSFGAEPRLSFAAIERAHACAARNHGLQMCRGEFVGFLDDDDYLVPEVAARQVLRLAASGADVASGGVDVVDDRGMLLRRWLQPDTNDIVEAMLSPHRLTLPTAHVFKRSILAAVRWDEALPIRQDTAFLMSVVAGRELVWSKSDEIVGAWVQHRGSRVSTRQRLELAARITADKIIEVVQDLHRDGRDHEARLDAAAEGLWSCVRRGLLVAPFHWHRIARVAERLSRGRPGPMRLHGNVIARILGPFWMELFLAPFRQIGYWVKRS